MNLSRLTKIAPHLSALLLGGIISAGSHAATKETTSMSETSKQLIEIIDSGKAYETEQIMPIFLKLDPIKPDEMFGQWKGGKFDGGKPDPINWYGKRFDSLEHVEPLLVTAADGSVQVFDKLGSARLREILYENKVSTALIYDKQPIIDYFRKITDDLIIGFGEVKGEGNDFFFYLARESASK